MHKHNRNISNSSTYLHHHTTITNKILPPTTRNFTCTAHIEGLTTLYFLLPTVWCCAFTVPIYIGILSPHLTALIYRCALHIIQFKFGDALLKSAYGNFFGFIWLYCMSGGMLFKHQTNSILKLHKVIKNTHDDPYTSLLYGFFFKFVCFRRCQHFCGHLVYICRAA